MKFQELSSKSLDEMREVFGKVNEKEEEEDG